VLFRSVLCWAAFQAGTIPGVLRAANGEGVFVKLAIEGLILGAVYSGFAWITVSIRRKKDDSFTLPGPRDGLAILACVLVGLATTWVVAQDGSSGQTLFAAFVAGLFGTFVARIVVPNCSFVSMIVAGGALAAIGPIAGQMLHGSSAIRDLYSGNISGFAMLTPVTWLAGVSMGVWGGSSWADSMVQKHDENPSGSPTRKPARG